MICALDKKPSRHHCVGERGAKPFVTQHTKNYCCGQCPEDGHSTGMTKVQEPLVGRRRLRSIHRDDRFSTDIPCIAYCCITSIEQHMVFVTEDWGLLVCDVIWVGVMNCVTKCGGREGYFQPNMCDVIYERPLKRCCCDENVSSQQLRKQSRFADRINNGGCICIIIAQIVIFQGFIQN